MTNTAISVGLIRAAFESEHFPGLFSGKETHDPALRFIGQIVAFTEDEDWITEMVRSGLPPDYASDTLGEVRGMVRDAIKKGFDKRETGEKEEKKSGSAAILLGLVEEAALELFHDPFKRCFIVVQDDDNKTVYPLSSTQAKLWLNRLFYQHEERPMTQLAFKQAHGMLEARALFDCPEKKIFLRVAPYEDKVVVNLADGEGRVVVIDKEGYTVTSDSPVMFVNAPAMGALPVPVHGVGDVLQDFQCLLGLEDRHFPRILNFLINCLKPEGPYLCLLTEGEQGSGKSILSEFCKTLIDPSQAPKIRMPDNERDLMIQAKDAFILLFDNISGMKGNLSDALCCLATGGGFSTRKLYTDDEQQIFSEYRPFICNGISGIATRPDLLERSVSVKLRPMPQDQRKSEREIRSRFREMQPHLLDKLFRITACALKNFESVETPNNVRMADAAQWLVAAESETGLPSGTLLSALEESQNEIVAERMAADPLAVALQKLVETAPFDGLMGDLFMQLENITKTRDRSFPPTAAHLSRALDRLRPALVKTGISVEFGPKIRSGKTIRVWLSEDGTFEESRAVRGRGPIPIA